MVYSEGRRAANGVGGVQGCGMLLADQQAGVPSGVLVTDQKEEGRSVGAGVAGKRKGGGGVIPAQTPPTASGDHGGGVVVIDHVAAVGGGVGAAAG